MMPALLEARAIDVWKGDIQLLNGVSLEVNAHDIWQIQGANGSGKTTLLRILCGLGVEDEGVVLWRGEPIHQVREQFHSSLLYLGHKPGISAALSPLENLNLFARLANVAVEEELLHNTLVSLSLGERMHLACGALSAGQQRRVALARLCLQQSDLWILDEPLTALDADGLKWVGNQLSQHALGGGAVVFTTHHAMAIDGALVRSLRLGA